MLDKISETEELQHLTTFTATVLAPEPALEANGKAWGSMLTGAGQGDPWSGDAVALGLQDSLEELDADCAKGGGAARAGADDVFPVGPPEVVVPAVIKFERQVKEKCGLTLQWGKTKVYCQEGEMPAGLPTGLRLAGEQVGDTFLRGLLVFGIPVGSDEYVTFKLREVAANKVNEVTYKCDISGNNI